MVVTKGGAENVEQALSVEEFLEAPVKKGQKVGTLSFTLSGEEVASFDIVTTENVDKITFKAVFCELFCALYAL